MCLYEVVPLKTKKQQFKLSKDKKGYYGWKTYKSISKYSAEPKFQGFPQKIGKWIKESECRRSGGQFIESATGKKYPTGFHVYLKRKQEIMAFSKKVYVKDIVAKGYQGSAKYSVIICKKIFIPKPKKEKFPL